MNDQVEAIWAAIDADADYVTELTRELVRIPTVNPKFQEDPDINREADAQAVVARHLDEAGFKVGTWEAFPERPNVVGDWDGDEEKSLIIGGHIDVVPVGDASVWDRDPFSGDVDRGHIWGRGAVDMKGGIAAAITAARAIHQLGIKLDGRLSVHSVVDEEAGGFGAIDLLRRGHVAKRAIISEPTWATWCRPKAA